MTLHSVILGPPEADEESVTPAFRTNEQKDGFVASLGMTERDAFGEAQPTPCHSERPQARGFRRVSALAGVKTDSSLRSE